MSRIIAALGKEQLLDSQSIGIEHGSLWSVSIEPLFFLGGGGQKTTYLTILNHEQASKYSIHGDECG